MVIFLLYVSKWCQICYVDSYLYRIGVRWRFKRSEDCTIGAVAAPQRGAGSIPVRNSSLCDSVCCESE